MEYIAAILPSIGVGILFFFAIRAIFKADRAERDALAQSEAEADAELDSELNKSVTAQTVQEVKNEEASQQELRKQL